MKASTPTARPIYIISGTHGAGKSTIAAALMQHFEFGVHIPVDNIRQWVVSGIVHPIRKGTDETDRQFRLARWSALQTATIYAEAGFIIALDDVVQEPIFQRQYQQLLHGYIIYKVLLAPSVEVAIQRKANCNKISNRAVIAENTRQLHEELSQANRKGTGWLIIDSSALTIDETVTQILGRTVGA